VLDIIEEFKRYRERMNAEILTRGGLGIKRFFALDDRVYEKGVLDVRTKELMGLVASTVLRCNDCIVITLSAACRRAFPTRSFLKL